MFIKWKKSLYHMMSPIEIQNKQGDYNLTTKIKKKNY